MEQLETPFGLLVGYNLQPATPPPNIIGLCGYKRAGKDEVYKALNLNHKRIERVAFADPLKRELAEACGVEVEFIDEHKEVFRPVMKWWGTDFRRNPEIGGESEYWIKQAEAAYHFLVRARLEVKFGATVERLNVKPICVVFTDCRFPNELELVRKLGGKIWRVVKAHAPSTTDDHASERALDGYPADRILYSHQGSLADFHARILKAYAEDFPCPTTSS